MSNIEASATLINQKLKFEGKAADHPSIIIDYIPPLGDGEGYMPLHLLLISLASCSGSTVVSLLRKMCKDVSGLKVTARGERRDEHPLGFKTINLDFIVQSSDIDGTYMQKAIQLSEQTYCPVWAMLKNNVEINTTYSINK
ncbi:OsmC family protein [Pelotomaculum propionicicum]|uniref:OsmC family protein n=1 Tax=Pelotomaculum propionicicum TaxID=258475 RepID=UPI003B768CAA